MNLKKEMRRGDTTIELSKLIQRRSKQVFQDYNCPPLSVNESGFLAKKLRKIVDMYGFNEFVFNVQQEIPGWTGEGKAPSGYIVDVKKEMAFDIIFELFSDINRWTFFSTSKKMMNRVLEDYRRKNVKA
jgi:hypothetical protein